MGLVFYMCTHVCTISNAIGIIKGKEVCLPNNEFISGHRCEKTHTAYKCKIFDTVSITLRGHYTHVYSSLSYWHKYRKQNVCQTRKA